MNYMKKMKMVTWNVRGLSNLDKCTVVRNILRKSRCDVICLQETKLNEKNLDYFGVVLPSYFDRDFSVLDACGTKGGVSLLGADATLKCQAGQQGTQSQQCLLIITPPQNL